MTPYDANQALHNGQIFETGTIYCLLHILLALSKRARLSGCMLTSLSINGPKQINPFIGKNVFVLYFSNIITTISPVQQFHLNPGSTLKVV